MRKLILIFILPYVAPKINSGVPPPIGFFSSLPYILGIFGTGPNFDPSGFSSKIPNIIENELVYLVNPNSAGNEEKAVKFYCVNHEFPRPIRVMVGQTSENFQFNFNISTYLITHGYTDEYSTSEGLLQLSMKALLKHTKSNICVVDWRDWAEYDYLTSISFITRVANYTAEFLEELHGAGLDYDKVSLIGHSLGAHIVGLTGRQLNGEIGTIYALEVAGLGFCPPMDFLPSELRIRKSDAKYVQTILTTPGGSCIYPIGHQNFYANLGLSLQPGCSPFSYTCAHYQAVYYFLSAVNPKNKYVAVWCKDQQAAILNDFNRSCNYSDTDFMGIHAKRKEGNYFFSTSNSIPPKPFNLKSPVLPVYYENKVLT